MKTVLVLSCLAVFALPRLVPVQEEAAREGAIEAVKAVLLDFREAARDADSERFFSHLDPEVTYMGTDSTERWTLEQLKKLVEPSFEQGVGWSSLPVERNVFLSDDARTAWFDMRLERPKFGEMRATGVLCKRDGEWKIVHYSVTLPVPNEVIRDVVKLIRSAG